MNSIHFTIQYVLLTVKTDCIHTTAVSETDVTLHLAKWNLLSMMDMYVDLHIFSVNEPLLQYISI